MNIDNLWRLKINMKRKLNSQELMLSYKNLERKKDELEYNLYQLKICELKLKLGSFAPRPPSE